MYGAVVPRIGRSVQHPSFPPCSELNALLVQEPGMFKTAQMPYNSDKNRYNDILPNDHTRMKLPKR